MYRPSDNLLNSKGELNFDKLSRDECIRIYRQSVIGKRIAEALPNYAISTPRNIQILEAPPEVAKRFIEISKSMNQDEIIRQCTVFARVFGLAGIYVALGDKQNIKTDTKNISLDYDNINDYHVCFNPLDTLVLSGTEISQDPFSINYLRPKKIRMRSKNLNPNRVIIVYGTQPIYLNSTTDLIPYAPPSVYYNILDQIVNYEKGLYDIALILDKAAAIIYTYKKAEKINGVTVDAIRMSAQIVQQSRSGNVLAIPDGNVLENWACSEIKHIVDGLDKIEHAIIQGLNDTPAAILMDRAISNGLSEGKEEIKSVLMAINTFQERYLNPLYSITDPIVMMKAWTPAFIEQMRGIKSEYTKMSDNEIRLMWMKEFKYDYASPYPEPESVKIENDARFVFTLGKLMEMGADKQDIEKEINESEMFKNTIRLNQKTQQEIAIEKEEQGYLFSDDEMGKPSRQSQKKKSKVPEVSKKGVLNLEDTSGGQTTSMPRME